MLCLAIKKSNLCICLTKSSIKTGQAHASKKKKKSIASVSQNTPHPKLKIYLFIEKKLYNQDQAHTNQQFFKLKNKEVIIKSKIH